MQDMNSDRPTGLEPVVVRSLLEEYRAGRDPIVNYDDAHVCLRALGLPLSPAIVRDLAVATWTLNGRNVAPLKRFIEAADEYIARRADRPNLKVAAAAKARAAKRKAGPR
jgi:hypothetical protein